VMKRIAAPMVGGAVTSLLLELLVYPVIYYLWRGRHLDPALTVTAEGDIHEGEVTELANDQPVVHSS